jgi:hypothetical protein
MHQFLREIVRQRRKFFNRKPTWLNCGLAASGSTPAPERSHLISFSRPRWNQYSFANSMEPPSRPPDHPCPEVLDRDI